MSYTFSVSVIVAICIGFILGMSLTAIFNLILWLALWVALATAASLAIDAMMGIGPRMCALRSTVRRWFARRRARSAIIVPFVRA